MSSKAVCEQAGKQASNAARFWKARSWAIVLFAFRDVVRQLDSKDVHLLRTVPVQFRTASGQQMGCSKLVITGTAAHRFLPHAHRFLPHAQQPAIDHILAWASPGGHAVSQ